MHLFVTEMCTHVHISVTKCYINCGMWHSCILGFVRWVYLNVGLWANPTMTDALTKSQYCERLMSAWMSCWTNRKIASDLMRHFAGSVNGMRRVAKWLRNKLRILSMMSGYVYADRYYLGLLLNLFINGSKATGDIFYLWLLYLEVWTLVIFQGTMRFYDDVIKRIFFRVTGPLKGIFLSPLDFYNKEPITRALCILYQPKQTI